MHELTQVICLLFNSVFYTPLPIIDVPCWNEPLSYILFLKLSSVNYVKLPFESDSINSLKYHKVCRYM